MISKIFELGTMWFCLTLCPQIIYSKKHRKERRYILNEIKEDRGVLTSVREGAKNG